MPILIFAINTTIVANIKYLNFSNPGLLEQEPKWEKGLIVLLCEYFYAG